MRCTIERIERNQGRELLRAAAGEEEPSSVHRASIGWSVLAAPPVEAQGTDLLASDWGETVAEHVVVFLTDSI